MYHHQNLTDGRLPLWRHGRAWLGKWGWEWCILYSPRLGVSIERDEEGVAASLRLILFSLHVRFAGLAGSAMRPREFNLRYHDGAVWFALWQDPMQSSRSDPWHRQMHVLHLDDLLLGKVKRTERTIEQVHTLIPMPEGAYRATVKLLEIQLKRPRWRRQTIRAADIDIPGGIPHSGKGENSWDCGDDGTWGLYTPDARTVEIAIGKLVTTCLESRRRYGDTSATRRRMENIRPLNADAPDDRVSSAGVTPPG